MHTVEAVVRHVTEVRVAVDVRLRERPLAGVGLGEARVGELRATLPLALVRRRPAPARHVETLVAARLAPLSHVACNAGITMPILHGRLQLTRNITRQLLLNVMFLLSFTSVFTECGNDY